MLDDLIKYIDLVGLKSNVMRSNWVFVSMKPKLVLEKDANIRWAVWAEGEHLNSPITYGMIRFNRTVSQGRLFKILPEIKMLATVIDHDIVLNFMYKSNSKPQALGKIPKFRAMQGYPIRTQERPDPVNTAVKDLKILKDLLDLQGLSELELWELFPDLMARYWRYVDLRKTVNFNNS